MKIGILGGTFDPIHEGHLKLARAAKDQFRLDRFFFVPAGEPPHKGGELTPAPFRYRMVEMALRNHPDFEISDMEIHRPGISYTVDTLKAFHQKFPQAVIYFVTGADAAGEVSKWHQAEEIFKLARIISAPRTGYTPIPHPKIEYLKNLVSPHSSSEIREIFTKNEAVPAGVLPEGVETYIRKNGLYGSASVSS